MHTSVTRSKWVDWILRPSGWILLVTASVFAALYGSLLLLHRLSSPFLRYEQHHYASLLVDSAGLTLIVIAAIYSFTFRMLRRNEDLLRHVVARLTDAVIVSDAQGRIVEWNHAAERLFQFARTDALGKSAVQFLGTVSGFSPQSNVRGSRRSPNRIAPGSIVDGTLRTRDGEHISVQITVSASPWQSDDTTLYVIRDISERKAIESDLQESEQQLRLTTQMAGAAIWTCDFGPEQMLRARTHESAFGLHRIRSRDIRAFLRNAHPDDRARSHSILDASVRPDGPNECSFDFRIVEPSGAIRWLWATGHVTDRDTNGRGTFARGVLLDITDRKDTESRLQRVSELYAALSQCNQAMMRCQTEEQLYPQICRAIVRVSGFTMAAIGMVDEGSGRFEHLAAFGAGIEYLDDLEISVDASNVTGRGPTGTCVRDGRPYWCQDYQNDPATVPWRDAAARFHWRSSAALPLLRKEKIVGALLVYSEMVGAFEDDAKALLIEMAADISFAIDRITDAHQHRRVVEELRQSDQYLRTVIETEPECVKVVGRDGHLLDINKAGLEMLELDSVAQARSVRLLDFVLPEYQPAFRHLHERVMRGESGTLEFEVRGLRGTHRVLETHAAPMHDSNGAVRSVLGVTRDVTERAVSAKRIEYLANFDRLTGLPNRNVLTDQLKEALHHARRENQSLCILFVDLDRFKDINDTLGHGRGDAFLAQVSQRLKSILREGDLVFRHGGDEFVLALPDSGARSAARVAEKILAAISKPCMIDGHELRVTASVGIAIFPHDGTDHDTLFRNADTAMYWAKRAGRNAFRFFTEEMQARAARNMALTHAMHRALEFNQFELHYQPQFEIHSGRVVGVEALLRWNHPELGNVSPSEFIPVAEYSGLILPIGEWALRTAAEQQRRWMAAGQEPMIMAVNLSAVQFRDRKLPDLVAKVLAQTGLPAEFLELELTESAAMHDPEAAFSIMEQLRRLGVRISLDDFGTGYSSFDYLKRFNIYKIKIDQSFVREIPSREEDRAIVSAIISVSKNLGLRTIAEGVETREQLAFLSAHDCDEVQGYYYCKPLPAAELDAFLRSLA